MASLPPAKTVVFPLLLAALAGLAACGAEEPAAQGSGPVPVSVVTLKPETVTLRRELPGRSTAYLVAEVRPQVDGIVLKRLFTEGGLVERGQSLYQIDDATYRADLNSARANVVRAQATLETAALNAKRSAQLVKVDAVSQQDDENAAAALRQAQADLKAAQAVAYRAETILGYARIKAPISGRIGKSSVTQGALVTANQTEPLATVQQLDPIYVDLTQSSAEWLQLRKQLGAGRSDGASDMPVTILLEDGTEYRHPGRLAFTEVSVDPTTGSFALRVVVPNPDHVLLPGMYVRAVVGTGVRENGLLVPQQGVARDPKGGTTAMVVGGDGKVELREVRVSQTVGDKWLVEEGLVPGDRVIVEGLQKIRPGAPVQPTEAAAPAPVVAATQQ
ncbi:MAG TPA: efflux RND transporter periplasmic adaptor subunit [Steroidobacteraceae bacterium]|nr:efflux RND transporter periplasmic adaptor subunit [Steroidobacteraceae bacterium]